MTETTALKSCTKCGAIKPLTEFHRAAGHPTGHRPECKLCGADYQRAYRQAFIEKNGMTPRQSYSYRHICEACGKSWQNRELKTRFCSGACANKVRRWTHVCTWCRKAWESGRADAKFCGDTCRLAAARAARSRVVLHLNPTPRYMRPPVQKPLKPLRKRWYGGQCAHCGTWFIHDQPQTLSCSPACSKRLMKARRRALKVDAFVERVYRKRIFERDRWKCRLCGKPVLRSAVVPHPRAPVIDHITPLAAGGKHEPANVQCAHFLCNSLKGDRGGGEQLLLIG